MVPRERIDAATVPGGEELTLFRRGADFFITLGRNELMTSHMSGSEEALAELACSGLGSGARVLIGGYGIGLTLRKALAVLPQDAEVVVAEIVPSIIAWARRPMAELTAGWLDDPRVRVIEGDVGAVIAAGAGEYDAIMLDVDNGPDGLSREGNDRLYRAGGLAAARGGGGGRSARAACWRCGRRHRTRRSRDDSGRPGSAWRSTSFARGRTARGPGA